VGGNWKPMCELVVIRLIEFEFEFFVGISNEQRIIHNFNRIIRKQPNCLYFLKN
jgi:hypothetical protein